MVSATLFAASTLFPGVSGGASKPPHNSQAATRQAVGGGVLNDSAEDDVAGGVKTAVDIPLVDSDLAEQARPPL